MATTIPAIFEFPGVTITREKRDMGVVKMLRRVRPDWRKEDIILRRIFLSIIKENVFSTIELLKCTVVAKKS